MIRYPGRITKNEARKRWEEGKPFIVIPCKCTPYEPSNYLNGYHYKTWAMAENVESSVVSDYITFDALVNEFEYYNCNFETGRYPAFYIPWEEYINEL